MGFFRSLLRFIGAIFGQAEGGTERATDMLLTSSPDAIRNQFRKTREDSIRDYNQMRDAVAELCKIRDSKVVEMNELTNSSKQADSMMLGAIESFKKTSDERYKEAYARFAADKEKFESRLDELETEVAQQDKMIESYKGRLMSLQKDIEDLKKEEAETVADIVSSRKINELNDKLQGLSQDAQSKNLEAIREARNKAKSVAKLSNELSGTDQKEFEKKILASGKASKHLAAFEEAVKFDKVFAIEAPIVSIEAKESKVEKVTSSVTNVDKLFS